MNIKIISHPLFFGSQSMPRFANYLAKGMREHGHSVDIMRPEPFI